jgi:hypothetical protein
VVHIHTTLLLPTAAMQLKLGHLFLQDTFSDVDVVLQVPPHDAAAGDQDQDQDQEQLTVLRRLPGHLAILSASPYLRAQVRCAQTRYGWCLCVDEGGGVHCGVLAG